MAAPSEQHGERGCGGVPLNRLLRDPALALRMGLFVADLTFLDEGAEDDYALDEGGRFHERTRRFRVQLNGFVGRPGSGPPAEFALFAPSGFSPPVTVPGEPARLLALLDDRLARPGINLVGSIPLGVNDGRLSAPAFGAAAGDHSQAVLERLRAVVPDTTSATTATTIIDGGF